MSEFDDEEVLTPADEVHVANVDARILVEEMRHARLVRAGAPGEHERHAKAMRALWNERAECVRVAIAKGY